MYTKSTNAILDGGIRRMDNVSIIFDTEIYIQSYGDKRTSGRHAGGDLHNASWFIQFEATRFN